MVTPTPPDWNTSHDLPPNANTIREEYKKMFLKLLRNKEPMNFLQEVPALENTAPSKQDGGGDST